jgi:hypothetical protein
MEQAKLSFLEILSLDVEINGIYRPAEFNEEGVQTQPEIKVKGLLNEQDFKSIVGRFRLGRINETITNEKKAFNDIQQELAKRLGEEKEGRVVIDREIDGKENPNFIEFQEENQKLLDEEREIEFKPIDLGDLNGVASEDRYSLIFKFVKED